MSDIELPRTPPYGPVGTSLIYEDAKVRIWETLVDPGDAQPMHHHVYPYVVVCIEPGDHRITSLDGEVRHTHELPGDVVVREPAIHKLENVGATRSRNRLIELKTEAL
ncbi:MAG: cupin domain-containing protein [Acidimicrobiales bacterium]